MSTPTGTDDHLPRLLVEWGDYRYGKISAPLSLLLHTTIVGLVLLTGRVVIEQTPKPKPWVGHDVLDIGAYLPPSLKPAGGGGGGGDRSPTEASQGRLPKLDLTQLAPPTAVIRNAHPQLPVEPSVIVPPDIVIPQPNVAQLGVPFSNVLGPPSNGPGSGAGMGDGDRGGVGPGHGPGVGPGKDGGFGGGAFRPGFGGVTKPQLVFSVEPEYSDAARRAKHQGTVVLYVVVDADGRVRNLRVVNSLGLGLDERAVEAVRQWKFQPGTKDGKAVPVVASVEVTFRLL